MDGRQEVEDYMEMRNHEMKSKRNSILKKIKNPKLKVEVNDMHDMFNEGYAYLLSQLKLRINDWKN